METTGTTPRYANMLISQAVSTAPINTTFPPVLKRERGCLFVALTNGRDPIDRLAEVHEVREVHTLGLVLLVTDELYVMTKAEYTRQTAMN